MKVESSFQNPFRPGAGHMPPYLAGRREEHDEFERILAQDVILENVILTGLRGVGKTVLLDTFKPMAISRGWLWVQADLSESVSVTEDNLAIRLLTDLSLITSAIVVESVERPKLGFASHADHAVRKLDFRALVDIYTETPGLVADKLKAVLELAWHYVSKESSRGLIFAYDEAQNLADNQAKGQFPLSLLLDTFQSIQKKGIPFMLVLTGLPTLFPKLVDARTFAERMFRVIFVDKLTPEESREAILKPIQDTKCPITFTATGVDMICRQSGGYPYFIQFVCREVYDVFIQRLASGEEDYSVPISAIIRKLDTDFFAGRWARVTDRQRELLQVIAHLRHDEEFTVQEVVAASHEVLEKGFGNSHASQLLASLCGAGLVYKNRHGKYSFAVPLFGRFILRQTGEADYSDSDAA